DRERRGGERGRRVGRAPVHLPGGPGGDPAVGAVKVLLRFVALGYLGALLLAPVGLVFYRTFGHGLGPGYDSLTTPPAISAFWLTVGGGVVAVVLNTVFGVIAALALARGSFRGKWLLDALIDLPFAVSPVVIGLALVLVYGRDGWIELPFQVIFS